MNTSAKSVNPWLVFRNGVNTLQFKIKDQDYFLAFVEQEKRWYVFAPTSESESHSSVCGCGEVSKTRNSGSRNRFVIIMKRELEPQRTQRSTEQNHRGLPH